MIRFPQPRSRLALLAALASVLLGACSGEPAPLITQDLVVGTGAEAVTRDLITVHYVGRFPSGAQFDSSIDRGQPFVFRLGIGMVIAGWDQGIPGMKVGGKRRLTIPPELGYGSEGSGKIPGGATLVFEVELLSIDGK